MRIVRSVTRNIFAFSLLAAAGSAGATITSTVEAAGVQMTTLQYVGGAVTFDTLSTGYRLLYATNVGTGPNALFDQFTVTAANAVGGAYGTRYITVNGATTVSLSAPVNYVGLWGSALDGGNMIELLMNGSSVGSYNLLTMPLTAAYSGNPNNGLDTGEKFAFFNFVSSLAFNQVRLLQNGGGGFELDNLTFGNYTPAPGVADVAEPTTLAVLLVGLGLIAAARVRPLAARPVLP